MDEFPREPTPEERELLDFMIEANREDADQLRLLFQDTKVLSLCSCGCGGPQFSANSELVPVRTWLTPLPDEANAEVEGLPVNVMLFADLDSAVLELDWQGLDPSEHPRLPRRDELEATLRLLTYDEPGETPEPDTGEDK